MNNICGTCENKIENEFINCGAFCGKPFHVKCANITKDTYDFLKTSLNCFWKCESCISLEKNPEITKRFKDNPDATKYDTNYNSDDSDSSNGPIISIPTLDIDYNTDNPNMGIALIFNHTDINGQNKRLGTEQDKRRINAALRLLGFDVRIYDDKTFAEIDEILTKAGNEDHSNNDCLLVVVMSHGITGQIFAKDMTYPVERLWKPFLGMNCKTLRNKPKLFFIDAGRGDQIMASVQYLDLFANSSEDMDVHDSVPKRVTYSIPNTADLLIMYSTFEGNYSWRNPVNGSWFIQSLSHVLEEAVRSKNELELIHLLTAVIRKIAYEYQAYVPHDKFVDEIKQMPTFVSTLTKKFKFIPKIIIKKNVSMYRNIK